jgi:hypothetical protein
VEDAMSEVQGERGDREDPFLAFIPDPELSGFAGLPVAEQKWRARIYMAMFLFTGSAPYSWAVAMDSDPEEVAAMRAFLAETSDEVILAGPAPAD